MVAQPYDAISRLRQDASLLETIERHAEAIPDKPFLILEGAMGRDVISFGALHEQAGALASLMRQKGVRPGDTVALLLSMHPALAPTFVGAMRAGALPFLLPVVTLKQDPALFWKAQIATLERSDPKLIVTDDATAGLLASHAPRYADRVLVVDAQTPQLRGGDRVVVPASRGSGAFLQFSSGTTGAKKGVLLTHGMVLDSTASLSTALGIEAQDKIASWLPLYHDMGLIGCFVLPLLLGITTIHISPFDWVVNPSSLLELIERHRATLCWQPNFAFQHLMRTLPASKSFDLSSMRAFINAAESCKADTMAAFRARFAAFGIRPHHVQASYGMAENVCFSSQSSLSAPPRVIEADMIAFDAGRIEPASDGGAFLSFVSTGAPIPHTQMRIVDEEGRPLPERRVGQITITSPYLFTGYYRSDFTLQKLSAGWYSTGDYGFIDEGEIFICGRRDELMIINGRNLYAPDIEFAINQETSVKPGRCVAIGPYSARTGSHALVVIAETMEADAAAQRALAHAIQVLVLAQFGVQPQHVLITSPGWIEKTTSGKIARGRNEAKYLAERNATSVSSAIRT